MSDFSIFTDAGLGLISPSPHCASWAWAFVEGGAVTSEASGVVTPDELGLKAISSNVAELLAIVRALESAPDGWSGTLYTDSANARRWVLLGRHARIPHRGLAHRTRLQHLRLKERLGGRVCLVKGHPSGRDLRRGHKNGVSVSPFNDYVDRLCARLCADWLRDRGIT